MAGKVADASVMAALVFEEPTADEADRLVRDTELYEPVLLAYELTHVALKKSLLRPDRSPAIETSLDIALHMVTRWVEVDHLAVLRLALDSGISAYDAAYLWAARSSGLPLVTFDEKLKRASRRLNR
jgi:predicted nucleic acid-binding protein